MARFYPSHGFPVDILKVLGGIAAPFLSACHNTVHSATGLLPTVFYLVGFRVTDVCLFLFCVIPSIQILLSGSDSAEFGIGKASTMFDMRTKP